MGPKGTGTANDQEEVRGKGGGRGVVSTRGERTGVTRGSGVRGESSEGRLVPGWRVGRGCRGFKGKRN